MEHYPVACEQALIFVVIIDVTRAANARRFVTRGFAARVTSIITTKMRACSQAIPRSHKNLWVHNYGKRLQKTLCGKPVDGSLGWFRPCAAKSVVAQKVLAVCQTKFESLRTCYSSKTVRVARVVEEA